MIVCPHCTRTSLQPLEDVSHPFCHPVYGLDCYSLVTVAGHDTPCLHCKPIRVEQDSLRKVGKFGLMT